ncbi:MAG: choice-of-anchor E domain-containing protein [Burkholderiales bacterium]|nr:choice-of-anchor E domain-containing protein [Burkholderiales bacterium]MDE1928132.1 choice-of-anchor E domain-containing protein [Burkholderiales bacterium]MDE2159304.1 choice-of-anchor E domain-containing protein [Burkholderiales bacterium]MDE2502854.1 choice-of-anchor E domain-containing protein [Burkholderiales bacterium]
MLKITTAALATLTAFAAHASTVSYSFQDPLAKTEINQSGNLNLFDSTLGTLTGATLTLDGANSTTFTLTNTSATAVTVKAQGETDLSFNSTLAQLDALMQPSNPLILLDPLVTETLAVGASYSTPSPLTALANPNFDLSSILSDLSVGGGGTFGLSCSSATYLNLKVTGGNVSDNQTTQASCGASITYTYTQAAPPAAVPEPGSLALVGAALAGIALAVRRRA